MAGSKPINNTSTSIDNVNISPSRLLIENNNFRKKLLSRNLYDSNRIYPLTEETKSQNIINSVNSVTSLIMPFKAFDLNNTVIGRLVSTPNTPLAQIGLAMLGTQLAYNATSHISQQTLPTIKLANLFDGSKNTHVFNKNIDYKITKPNSISTFQQFLNAIVFANPEQNYPFTKTSTNADFIKNSGSGQLTFLYQALNQNLYKEGFSTSNYFGISSNNDSVLNQSSVDVEMPLTKRNNIIGSFANPLNKFKNYYSFFNLNPYSSTQSKQGSINDANGDMVISMNRTNPQYPNTTQEYAPDYNFVKYNFGETVKKDEFQISQIENSWISTSDENDDIHNKIVWGRDGISSNANKNIADSRGNSLNVQKEVNNLTPDLTRFNVYSGLLEYTRNLLNASEGGVVDITRKAFKKGQNVIGFNGSAMWAASNSTYSQKNGTAGKTGIRQHSMLDQYDRFAKAIRFNGNQVYGGNPDSVTYNSVIPRIHPTLDKEGKVNSKNLMFSIENLAVRVIGSDGVGIIDDEYGSTIPISEVGQFNGRLMWFPPYNMEVNESESAKFEPTVMVGRNEPMYSYMYSERSATVSFSLIVDYPMNLKNQLYQGTDKHRLISEFFAFGGESYNPITPPTVNPNKIQDGNNKKQEIITGPVDMAEPDVLSPQSIKMYFPNDYPTQKDNLTTVIDYLYKTMAYEIDDGCFESTKIKGNGFNSSVYIVTGLTGSAPDNNLHLNLSLLPPNFSQYNLNGDCPLNNILRNVYSNEVNRKYYDIIITGAASKSGTDVNNQSLGIRRAQVAQIFVTERIKAIFANTPDKLGINITYSSIGSTTAENRNLALENEDPAVIFERYAEIKVIRNNVAVDKKVQPLTTTDTQAVQNLKKDNAAADNISKKQNSNKASENVFKERTVDLENGSNDGGILKGFKSISGNYFYPVFHSQTPEDFHRRLTFLHQCMRQGSAKRFDTVDSQGNLTARNSVFGRQPICVLRIGDQFYTKVIIENLTIDYSDAILDTNPENFGVQYMSAKITLQMKVLGGQSLKGPIDALQNAVTFNQYANSTFSKDGMYYRPSTEADKQEAYMSNILTVEQNNLTKALTNVR